MLIDIDLPLSLSDLSDQLDFYTVIDIEDLYNMTDLDYQQNTCL